MVQEAIAKKSYFAPVHTITRGDVTAGFSASAEVVEGEVHIEAQEHFYLETHAAIVRPGEDGEMEIFATTQGPTLVQVGRATGGGGGGVIQRQRRSGRYNRGQDDPETRHS